MNWSYGVMTCTARMDTLLPRTLESLALAGFDRPRLFVDGATDPNPWFRFGLEVTTRDPQINTAPNWVLSAAELFFRNPEGERYAIFQDDCVTMRNLRTYLEKCQYPDQGYWNLYTFPQYASALQGLKGWQVAPAQRGLGAVGLVFSREALITLLSSRHLYDRAHLDVRRGLKAIDGGIVTALKGQGRKEFVHLPSLLQHTGNVSSIGNSPQPQADTFPGEHFDALDLL